MKERWKAKLKNKKVDVRFPATFLVLAVLAAASVYTVFIKPKQGEETVVYKETQVQRGDLVLGIMESGSISLEETTLDYTLELDTSDEEDDEDEDDDEDEETIKYPEIEAVYVVSGQRIEEGEPLFKLTEESTEAVRKNLNSLYAEAQIAYTEAETDYQIQLLNAKSVYDTSLLEAAKAQSTYQASSARTQESVNRLSADIKVLEAEITWYRQQLEDEKLWESLEEAQAAYTSAENIYKNTDVHNATAYADNYTEYKTAKEQLESIQKQIDNLNESIAENEKSITKKQEDLSVAQATLEAESLSDKSNYDSAVLGGELAEDIYRYTVDSLEETVKTAKTDQEEAKEKLDGFEAFVGEDGIIYADGSGLVTNVSYEAGDKLTVTGAMLSYVKEDAYTVSIDVSEEDIPAIKVGDKVDVVMTAYPDAVCEGRVASITAAAASEYAATVSYPVTVKIEGDTTLLYGGMTAEVTFVTDSVSDVLYVSRKAIQSVDGKNFVYVDAGAGKKKLTEVETGFSDGANTEIISGLSEGDTVYIESRISGDGEGLTESEAAQENEGAGFEEKMVGEASNDSMPPGGMGETKTPGNGNQGGVRGQAGGMPDGK